MSNENHYYNPVASYAHPPMHEIGSHIPVVDDRYPGISLSCGFDIADTGRKSYVILYLKTQFKV